MDVVYQKFFEVYKKAFPKLTPKQAQENANKEWKEAKVNFQEGKTLDKSLFIKHMQQRITFYKAQTAIPKKGTMWEYLANSTSTHKVS